MSNCKGVKTPCDKLIFDDDSRAFENKLYRRDVGSLLYAMVATRPDLSYIVTKLSQYNNSPNASYWTTVKRVFRYIQYSIDYSLVYKHELYFPTSWVH